ARAPVQAASPASAEQRGAAARSQASFPAAYSAALSVQRISEVPVCWSKAPHSAQSASAPKPQPAPRWRILPPLQWQQPNRPAETQCPTHSQPDRIQSQSGKVRAPSADAEPRSPAPSQSGAAGKLQYGESPARPPNASARSASSGICNRGSSPSPSRCAL